MPRFSSRSTKVHMLGGAGVGIQIGPGPGDFSHGQTNAENTEKLRVMDRGRFEGHVEGDDLEQEWSLTVGQRNEAATNALLPIVLDFVQRTGIFDEDTGSTPVQSVDANPDVWAWKTIVTMLLGGTSATFTLPQCIGGYSFSVAKEGNSIALSGTNNGKIART